MFRCTAIKIIIKELPFPENPWLAKPLFFVLTKIFFIEKDIILIEPHTLF